MENTPKELRSGLIFKKLQKLHDPTQNTNTIHKKRQINDKMVITNLTRGVILRFKA